MPAGVYLIGNAAYQRVKRQRQIDRGQCVYCHAAVHRFRACVACRDYQAAGKRRQRERRKVAA